MPDLRLAARGTDRRPASAAFVSGAFALGWTLAAGCGLYEFAASGAPSPLLVPSSVLLAACGLTQGWLLADALRSGCWQRVRATVFCVGFWQTLLSGAALAYLAALLIGPVSGIGWAWLASLAVWHTLLLLPLASSAQAAENWRRWLEIHRPGRLNWLVAASAITLVATEGLLRLQLSWEFNTANTADTLEVSRLEANAATLGGQLEVGSDWAIQYGMNRGRLRVGLLGDQHHAPTQFAKLSHRVQQAVPGAEIVSISTRLGHADAAKELSAALEESRPDVVLAVLPACAEWVSVHARRSAFDCQRFEIGRLLFGEPESSDAPRAIAAADYEAFLGNLSPHVAACRTPLDETMHARWERTFAALDEAIATCREREIPLALVVVPGELQLNPGLRSTLLRRYGMTAEQIDVELPQRRLAGYAQQREVPVVDLLPHLRLCREAIYERHHTALNDGGHLAAASAIGGWLESRYGDQLAAQLSRNQ